MATKPKRTTKTRTTKSESESSGGERSLVSPVGGPLKPDEKRGSAKKHRRTKNGPPSGPTTPKGERDVNPAKTAASKADRELTWKESRFVDHYLATGNATESARQAGYSGSNEVLGTAGWRLLKKAEVSRALRARAEISADELLTSRTSRVRWLLLARDGAMQMEQAMPTGEGIVTIRAEVPPRERLKAAEILARMHGDLLEKVLTSNSLADLMTQAAEAEYAEAEKKPQ